jgi:hypothetical protein
MRRGCVKTLDAPGMTPTGRLIFRKKISPGFTACRWCLSVGLQRGSICCRDDLGYRTRDKRSGASGRDDQHYFCTGIFRPDGLPYNCSRLAREVLLGVLHTYRLAILGNHVSPNLFYQAPLILAGNAKSSAAQVEWLISQLKSARGAKDRQRSSKIDYPKAQKMESTVESEAGRGTSVRFYLTI